MTELSVLDPKEVALVVVAVAGLVLVMRHYREQSKWFVAGYLLLVVGAVTTNLEAFALGVVFDFTEHAAGLLGSAAAFAGAAYLRRKNVVTAEGTGGGGDADG